MNRTDSDRPTKKEADTIYGVVEDVKITDAMIKAGWSAAGDEDISIYSPRRILSAIFRAMLAARKWEIERMKSQK